MKVGGEAVPREHHLLAAYVTLAMNRVAAARLVYMDGSAAAGAFPLSDAPLFAPGAEVEVLAGDTADPVPVFSGIVVRHALKVRAHTAPQLVVDCRSPAVKLTVGRRSALFSEQTDADVIAALLEGAGLSAEVESTPVTHEQLVQFDATDWDFLLARARACGLVVFTGGESVRVAAPETGGSPALQLRFGATILEMDLEVDARSQFAGVRAVGWDPAQQALAEAEAADPGFTGPGDLAPDDLAGVVGLAHLPLAHAPLGAEEAQAWADAEWLRSRLGKVAGRVKCEGVASVRPGDTVTLGDAGERFNGDVLVTGVRHDFDLVQGWKTHVQFGEPYAPDELAPAAGRAAGAGLIPGIGGLQVGVVVSNEDPGGEHRVRVRLPLVHAEEDGPWARVAAPDAGAERGFFFRPEVGDEVVVGFLADDPRYPVILGMLHSSALAAPLEASDANPEKAYVSREGMRLSFDDEKKVLLLETPAGNSLTLSEDEQAILIADQNGNTIEMTADGITIESAGALELKAATEVKLESGTSFDLKGGTELKLEGSAGAEISSSAITKVKGSLVQLN